MVLNANCMYFPSEQALMSPTKQQELTLSGNVTHAVLVIHTKYMLILLGPFTSTLKRRESLAQFE